MDQPGSHLTPGSGDHSQRRSLAFGVLAGALLMGAIDQTMVAVALVSVLRDFGTTTNVGGWILTIYALGQIVALPLAAQLTARFGARRVVLGAMVTTAAASIGCATAGNVFVLVGFRAMQSLGAGAVLPASMAIIAAMFGPSRDRAVGLFASIGPVGGIVGPIVGGVVLTHWSWRAMFLVGLPVTVAAAVAVLLLIPETRPDAPPPLDLRGLVLLTLALSSLMVAVSYLGERGPLGLVGFSVSAAFGVAGLIGLWFSSTRSDYPMIPLRLLHGRGFAVMNLINFLHGVVVLGFSTLVPLYAQQRYDLPVLQVGSMLTVRAVGMVSLSALTVLALRRIGCRPPMVVGFVLTGAGLVLMALPPAGTDSPLAWLTISAAVTGVGMGVSVPAANNAGLQLEPQSVAALTSVRGMMRQSGGILSISVLTALLARSSHPGQTQATMFVALAVLLLLLVPMIIRVPEHRGRW